MSCPHYSAGYAFGNAPPCLTCLQDKNSALLQENATLRRQLNALMQRLGEEPID